MEKELVYCVWAYRYGDREGYNFPVGVFSSLSKAIEAAKSHYLYRGGKYEHLIYTLPMGVEFDACETTPIEVNYSNS